MSLPMLFTPEEIALNVKVTRRTVYYWLSSGKLNGLRVGSSWRITQADLLVFMTHAAHAKQPVRVEPQTSS
ncbi:MAG: helix-turn-helix domain-containing protein [Bryobacteraceae bacterium]